MALAEIESFPKLAVSTIPQGTVLLEKKIGGPEVFTGSVVVADAEIIDHQANLDVRQSLFGLNGVLCRNDRSIIRQIETNVNEAPPLLQRIGAQAIYGVQGDHVGIFFDPIRTEAIKLVSSMNMSTEDMELLVNCTDIDMGSLETICASAQTAQKLIQDEAVIGALQMLEKVTHTAV